MIYLTRRLALTITSTDNVIYVRDILPYLKLDFTSKVDHISPNMWDVKVSGAGEPSKV